MADNVDKLSKIVYSRLRGKVCVSINRTEYYVLKRHTKLHYQVIFTDSYNSPPCLLSDVPGNLQDALLDYVIFT